MLLVGGTAFLFGGSYLTMLPLPGLLCVLLLLFYRPRPWSGDLGPVNGWLTLVAALILFQILPLPASLIDRLSPHAREVWESFSLGGVRGALPISVDLWSTVWALAIYALAIAVFFAAQSIFASGGVRIVTRGIASVGLILAAEGLAQDASAHGLMYWRWRTPFEGAPPFGPFFNRDHFATWVVMAVPLSFGYLLAHGSAHAHRSDVAGWRPRLRAAADARSLWLSAAICLMLVGLVASLSRAGMAGLIAAIALGMTLQRRRRDGLSGWGVAAIALAALLALARVDLLSLYERITGTAAAAAGRVDVWRATVPIVRDFWLTGSGTGTFATVMLAYQRVPSLFRINAAHNHYLQLAAEGGVLIAVPAAIAGVVFVRAALQAIRHDASGIYLIRVGAFSGLVGVAVQSLWETGLATPANALLAAVLAAIVVHRSPHHPRTAG